MKTRDQVVAFLFSTFLLVLWLGFLIHRDEHFAGSFWGGVLAVSGSILLLIPLLYSLFKRISLLKRMATKKISFSTFLSIHIYAGFIGAILVLLHTGHKFHGLLATVLTGILLTLVFSGYIGRYLLAQISKEISEKRQLLSGLKSRYESQLTQFKASNEERQAVGLFTGLFSRLVAPFFLQSAPLANIRNIFYLTDAIADVEYAISTHELMKGLFSFWLKFHLILSFVFYLLLILHIAGEYYFGLRWFS
ncbi:MAG: hypothetical protein A4S09_15245 [Proteobacteria bacterium SG_bin7]|nr:MAG: hypothetical protein A4S09_15245 [Proteobacteria bacterium SG_bin7]